MPMVLQKVSILIIDWLELFVWILQIIKNSLIKKISSTNSLKFQSSQRITSGRANSTMMLTFTLWSWYEGGHEFTDSSRWDVRRGGLFIILDTNKPQRWIETQLKQGNKTRAVLSKWSAFFSGSSLVWGVCSFYSIEDLLLRQWVMSLFLWS